MQDKSLFYFAILVALVALTLYLMGIIDEATITKVWWKIEAVLDDFWFLTKQALSNIF